MIFSHRTVKSFRLSVSPGGTERMVAFGPGAVVSGSVFLTLEKPLQAYNIRVLFRCEQKTNRSTNTIFNVESIIWGRPRSESTTSKLKEGCHMYLFAIKLPNVNYPPSMHDNDLGYRVDYSLQGFLGLHDQRVMETTPARVIYLPFISCVTDDIAPKKTEIFKRGRHNLLQLTLQTSKPAYCPGDRCTIKLNIKNRSEHKIASYQVALVAMATTEKTHTIHSETIYNPVGKHAINSSVCHFQIPSHCTPSLGINYHIIVTLPWGTSSWKFPTSFSNVSMGVPITIATVPATYPVPRHLQLPLPSYLQLRNGTTSSLTSTLPSFIPSIESPEPSPTSPVSIVHSPSPSLSVTDNNHSDDENNDNHSLDGRTLCDGWSGNHHYASSPPPATTATTNNGFLTVPTSSTSFSHHAQYPSFHHSPPPQHHHHRRSSTSSVLTDCSAEINSVISDASSQTRVAVQ